MFAPTLRDGTPRRRLSVCLARRYNDNEPRYSTPGRRSLAPPNAAGALRHSRRLGARRGGLAPHGLGRALGFQEPVLSVPALSRHRVGARRATALESVPF